MLTKWETFFLLVMTLPIMGHVVILPFLLDIAGRDAWISILLAFPIGLLISYVIYRIRRKFPDLNGRELLNILLGKWLGIIIIIILILYFLFLTV